MSYAIAGTASYTVAEPVGRAPKDYKKGRRCEKEGCSNPLNRYSGPTEGFFICESCINKKRDSEMDTARFVGKPPRGQGRYVRSEEQKSQAARVIGGYRPPGRYLPGLHDAMTERGWDGATLARIAGANVSQVPKLRRCAAKASEEMAGKLAKALGVEVARLTQEEREEEVA